MNHHVKIDSIKHVTHDVLQIRVEKPPGYSFTPGQANMITKQIVLASRPIGMPTVGNFRFENIELPDLQDGKVLLKGLYYSADPYMRGRMNDARLYCWQLRLSIS